MRLTYPGPSRKPLAQIWQWLPHCPFIWSASIRGHREKGNTPTVYTKRIERTCRASCLYLGSQATGSNGARNQEDGGFHANLSSRFLLTTQ